MSRVYSGFSPCTIKMIPPGAPVKPDPVNSRLARLLKRDSVKKKLDFSTVGTIDSKDDDGEEVTSKYRPLKK